MALYNIPQGLISTAQEELLGQGQRAAGSTAVKTYASLANNQTLALLENVAGAPTLVTFEMQMDGSFTPTGGSVVPLDLTDATDDATAWAKLCTLLNARPNAAYVFSPSASGFTFVAKLPGSPYNVLPTGTVINTSGTNAITIYGKSEIAGAGREAAKYKIRFSDPGFVTSGTSIVRTLTTFESDQRKLMAVIIDPRTAFSGAGLDTVRCTVGSGTAGNEDIFLGATGPLDAAQTSRSLSAGGCFSARDVGDSNLDVVLSMSAFQSDPSGGSDFAPHDLTSETSHSPVVIANSAHEGSSAGWRAFDSAAGNGYFIGNTGGVAYISIDLGSGNSRTLKSYSVVGQAHTGESARAPKTWTMQGSNNGTTWTTIDTVASETAWTLLEERTYTCDDVSTAYRYFKINVTANNGSATNTVIGEMKLFGADTPASFGNGTETNLTAGELWVTLITEKLPD